MYVFEEKKYIIREFPDYGFVRVLYDLKKNPHIFFIHNFDK